MDSIPFVVSYPQRIRHGYRHLMHGVQRYPFVFTAFQRRACSALLQICKAWPLGHYAHRARGAFLRVAAEGAVDVVEWRLWWRVVQVSLMQMSCGWWLLFIALGVGCSVPSRKNKVQCRPTDLQGRSQHTINTQSTHSQHTVYTQSTLVNIEKLRIQEN